MVKALKKEMVDERGDVESAVAVESDFEIEKEQVRERELDFRFSIFNFRLFIDPGLIMRDQENIFWGIVAVDEAFFGVEERIAEHMEGGFEVGIFFGSRMQIRIDALLDEEFRIAVAFFDCGIVVGGGVHHGEEHAGMGGGVHGNLAREEGFFPDDRFQRGARNGEDVIGFIEPENLRDGIGGKQAGEKLHAVALDEDAVDIDQPFRLRFEFWEGLLENEAGALAGADIGLAEFYLAGGAEIGADLFAGAGIENFEDHIGDAAGEGLDENFFVRSATSLSQVISGVLFGKFDHDKFPVVGCQRIQIWPAPGSWRILTRDGVTV